MELDQARATMRAMGVALTRAEQSALAAARGARSAAAAAAAATVADSTEATASTAETVVLPAGGPPIRPDSRAKFDGFLPPLADIAHAHVLSLDTGSSRSLLPASKPPTLLSNVDGQPPVPTDLPIAYGGSGGGGGTPFPKASSLVEMVVAAIKSPTCSASDADADLEDDGGVSGGGRGVMIRSSSIASVSEAVALILGTEAK